ncbi:MAG: TetR/AcrR family transcriptional regulator [Bacteroidota bacterium]
MTEVVDSPKERILAHAQERFRHEGFAKISIDDLASSLGMSKKTIYKIFSNKEDIIEQIMNRRMGEIATSIDRIVAGSENFSGKLRGLMTFFGSIVGQVGFPMVQDVQRLLPHLWKKVEEFRAKRIIETFGNLVDQGMREGFIRPDLNKRLFLLAYLNSVQQIMQPAVLAHESFSAREAIQEIIEIFFRGTMTDAGRKQFEQLQQQQSSL